MLQSSRPTLRTPAAPGGPAGHSRHPQHGAARDRSTACWRQRIEVELHRVTDHLRDHHRSDDTSARPDSRHVFGLEGSARRRMARIALPASCSGCATELTSAQSCASARDGGAEVVVQDVLESFEPIEALRRFASADQQALRLAVAPEHRPVVLAPDPRALVAAERGARRGLVLAVGPHAAGFGRAAHAAACAASSASSMSCAPEWATSQRG
jgi:hypothetical protein